MQRYYLFAGDVYYASGGWHDLQGTYATFIEALRAARAWQEEHGIPSGNDDYAWHHIVDSVTGQIVAGTRQQGYGADPLTLPEERLYAGPSGTQH